MTLLNLLIEVCVCSVAKGCCSDQVFRILSCSAHHFAFHHSTLDGYLTLGCDIWFQHDAVLLDREGLLSSAFELLRVEIDQIVTDHAILWLFLLLDRLPGHRTALFSGVSAGTLLLNLRSRP